MSGGAPEHPFQDRFFGQDRAAEESRRIDGEAVEWNRDRGAPLPEVVQLFPTCMVNELRPSIAIAAVELIERLGIRVELPRGLGCCGQPAWNAGFADEARAVALQTIEKLAATTGPIVIPSGSCGDMLLHQTAELFRDDPKAAAKARVVASRCVELIAFLHAVRPNNGSRTDSSASANPTNRSWNARSARVAYHPSCHLARGLGVTDAPVDLLQARGGSGGDFELVALDRADECCGFGGLFSAKQPELSGALLDAKCRAIEASGATHVASCDLGCLLHLEGGLRRRGSTARVCHVAELLAKPPP